MNIFDFLIEPFQYEFIHRALIASIITGISCGLIGAFIMLRRMSLLGDALAHAVLPGVVIGFMIAGKGQLAIFIGAVISGFITVVLISYINRNSKIKEDTSIGVIFTGAFALGILLVSQLKQVHIDLSSYLFGDVLGVSTDDIILSSIIMFAIIISVILFYKQLLITSFDPTMAMSIGISTAVVHYFLMSLLSMTIVTSLQSVGIVLLVAMLITPPATAYLLTDRMKPLLFLSAGLGTLSGVTGLFLSYYFNFSSGASMVLVSVTFFALAFFFSPKEGVLTRAIRRRKKAQLHLVEDIIKAIYKADRSTGREQVISNISFDLGISASRMKSIVRELIRLGMVNKETNTLTLTATGEKVALKLVRSHRLWETYITEHNITDINDIHEDAEKFEHILSEELAEEIDRELGHPETDPHGSPIPKI
jgi:ABC-type Mn2+/Zn2+ transport system permease subunit/Mn-dependent DtxR family transcriptional regulator